MATPAIARLISISFLADLSDAAAMLLQNPETFDEG
jgi:hypothetical protein